LRGKHVHALRAADTRHQLHGEERSPGLGERIETLGLREGIEHTDDGRALLHGFDDFGAGSPHREHDIGIGNGLGVGLGDPCPRRLVIFIGKVGAQSCARADCHVRAGLHELLDRLRSEPDTRLVRLFGRHANRDHRSPKA
jgi:hypothetical protein